MKSKLEMLEQRKNENDRQIEDLRAKLARLEADRDAAVAAANLAAETGSVEEYAAKKRKVDEAEAAVFVTRTVLDKKQNYPGASKEEAAEAWNEFLKTENKSLTRYRKAFDQALKEAKIRFDEMISEERKVYAVRHRCGEICGFRTGYASSDEADFINTLPMSELSALDLRPYLDYLSTTGGLSTEEIREVYVTLNRHGL